MAVTEKDLREENRDDSSQSTASHSVLCVDLDGTLLKTDLLWECIISLLKASPSALFGMPFWLLQGRARFKQKLAERARVDVTTLPYNPDLLAFLTAQRQQGRHLVLVTAADGSLAQNVANHLGLFDEVLHSQEGRNLKGEAKAELLLNKFAQTGFDYVGNSTDDLPAWKAARAGYIVGDKKLIRRASSVVRVEGVFERPTASFLTWLRAFRGHHWAKNLLLFLPLLLAHRLQLPSLLITAAGFLLFSFCASSLYILNDLLDLHSDRAHPWKGKRPFASGETPIPVGLLVSALLIVVTIALSFSISIPFGAVLAAYSAATLWYSLQLKRLVLVDVFVLSSFYSLRIWAGSLLTSVPLSDWFLVFSLFFFLALAMAKRYSELTHAGHLVQTGKSGRAYNENDRALLMHLGVGSSFSAVVIFALYIHSKEVLSLYPRPEFLFLICPAILYWLSRLWLKANRGELDEDPVTLSIRDPISYAVAALVILVMLISSHAG
jgi:4-hydroxybenzoate polyprenyltransferase